MMRSFLKRLAAAACVVLVGITFGSGAEAQIPEVSYLPVEEPLDVGGTILEPGVYLIRVLPGYRNRNLLQITNEDRTTIFTTVLSVPHALPATEEMKDTKFVFFPATDGAPRALRTWYAPDSTSEGGHDIVYPERRALQLAAVAREPVVAYKGEPAHTQLEDVELEVVSPEQKIARYEAPTSMERTTPSIAMSDETREMPRTAGNGPLIAMIGLLALAAALGVRALRTS